MKFGNVSFGLDKFRHNQFKAFKKVLIAGKYRGDFEQAWKDYRKASKKK